MTTTIIFGLALFAFALTRVPDKYKPTWAQRLSSWQALIGVVAIIAAILIVMNPEFYALGVLGDSAFFDLLVLAIGVQMQVIFSRIGACAVSGAKSAARFIVMGIYADCILLMLIVSGISCMVQGAVHRILP